MLTPADINGFLAELGLEPTSSDVLHIIDELDWSSSGIVSRCAPCLEVPQQCLNLLFTCLNMPVIALEWAWASVCSLP